ncbi:hypothetical protein [Nocardia sp. BMG51109]|uniref:hypothetical protein n=1 Tax=Nocardia sp. BMG51109 TaxID=1056816 RepID=UPI0004676C05|nr:hypothetical protein [Nocardia sp. BMG51109]
MSTNTELATGALSRELAELEELDVVLGEPFETAVSIHQGSDWLEIGCVVIRDEGGVEAIPERDCTAGQILVLLRHAEDARLAGPVGSWWQCIPEVGWFAAVLVPIDERAGVGL